MSVTHGHQRAFRALSGCLSGRAEATADRGAHEVMLGIADALNDAADRMQREDMAAHDTLDRRHSTIAYDPKAKR